MIDTEANSPSEVVVRLRVWTSVIANVGSVLTDVVGHPASPVGTCPGAFPKAADAETDSANDLELTAVATLEVTGDIVSESSVG